MESVVMLVLATSNAVTCYYLYKMSQHVKIYRESITRLKSVAVLLKDENNSLKKEISKLNNKIVGYESKIKKVSEFFQKS